jgi:hypothetical protein
MEVNTNTTHVMSEIDYKIKISDETIKKYDWEIQKIELSLDTDPKNKKLREERLDLKIKQSNEKINNFKLRQKLKESNQSEEPPQKKQKKIHTLNVQESQEEYTNDSTYQDEQEEEEEENENEDDEEEEEYDEQEVISNSKIQTRSMSINKEEKERIDQERFLQDTTPRYPRRSNSKIPNQK